MEAALSKRFGALLISEKYTDCCFIIDPEAPIINCHKLILASASPVFEAMFFGSYVQNQRRGNGEIEDEINDRGCVHIKDVSENAFKTMIYFIYTNQLSQIESLSIYDLIEVFYCSEKYLLMDLVQITVDELSRRLSSSNHLFLVYDFAIKFGVNQLISQCRQMFKTLLVTKTHFFFKKTLSVQCQNVINYYSDETTQREDNNDHVKRMNTGKVDSLDDLDFTVHTNNRNKDEDDYHQVSKKTLADIILHSYDKPNRTFNDNLHLFVVKWMKIEWKLENPKRRSSLTIECLDQFFAFITDKKLRAELISGLLTYLNNHKFLNNPDTNGWYLLQRTDLKAGTPLVLSSNKSSSTHQFSSKLFVNHLITIKSFIINSRFSDLILSKFVQSNPKFCYNEDLSIEILCENVRIFHQKTSIENVEFNSQVELYLNKFLYFLPGVEYTINFLWDVKHSGKQYPRKIFETSAGIVIGNKEFNLLFVDDVKPSDDSQYYYSQGSIIAGIHFMFLNP